MKESDWVGRSAYFQERRQEVVSSLTTRKDTRYAIEIVQMLLL